MLGVYTRRKILLLSEMRLKKVRPALGESRPPRTRSGDGEGWGRDRVRDSSRSARRCDVSRRARIAERNPNVRIGLRLALDEAIAGVRPRQNFGFLVVENEFAPVGADGQDSVAVTLFVAHDSDQKGASRPAELHQYFAFQQNVILAVAIAVIGVSPFLDDPVMIEISHRLDLLVDVAIDPIELRETKLGNISRRRASLHRLCTLSVALRRTAPSRLGRASYLLRQHTLLLIDLPLARMACLRKKQNLTASVNSAAVVAPVNRSSFRLSNIVVPLFFPWGQCGKKIFRLALNHADNYDLKSNK